jgi:hypothetical protein
MDPIPHYSGYDINSYFFNIIDYRLNNQLFHQEYLINNPSGNYSGVIDNRFNPLNSNICVDTV